MNKVCRNYWTSIHFILLSKHFTFKHANNKGETLASLTERWTQSRTHRSVFILNIHRKQSTVRRSIRRATAVTESSFYCFKCVRAVVGTHFFTCIDKYFPPALSVNEWKGLFQHQVKGGVIFTALQIFLLCSLQQAKFTCNTTRNKKHLTARW